MVDPLFVAAVLEGFERKIYEVVDRVEDRELKSLLEVLKTQVAAMRILLRNQIRLTIRVSFTTEQNRPQKLRVRHRAGGVLISGGAQRR